MPESVEFSKTKTCGGRQVLSKRLSKSISPALVPIFEAAGFVFEKRYVTLGILKMSKNGIVVNGAFCNKVVNLTCNNSISNDDECLNLANAIIELIEQQLK